MRTGCEPGRRWLAEGGLALPVLPSIRPAAASAAAQPATPIPTGGGTTTAGSPVAEQPVAGSQVAEQPVAEPRPAAILTSASVAAGDEAE